MKVIIESYINDLQDNIDEVKASALSMVESLDTINDSVVEEGMITKLYYIAPRIGKILVVVSEKDAKILGVDSQIIADTDIKDYPLEKLPAKIIDYKELIIKKGSALTDVDIKNVAQAMADEEFSKVLPYKIPVIKVINYNTNDVSKIFMPSIFGDNIFTSVSGIVNDGDAEAGKEVLENTNKEINAELFSDISEFLPKVPDTWNGVDFKHNWYKLVDSSVCKDLKSIDAETWKQLVDNMKVGILGYNPDNKQWAFFKKETLLRNDAYTKLQNDPSYLYSKHDEKGTIFHIENSGGNYSGIDYSFIHLCANNKQFMRQDSRKARFDLKHDVGNFTSWNKAVFLIK